MVGTQGISNEIIKRVTNGVSIPMKETRLISGYGKCCGAHTHNYWGRMVAGMRAWVCGWFSAYFGIRQKSSQWTPRVPRTPHVPYLLLVSEPLIQRHWPFSCSHFRTDDVPAWNFHLDIAPTLPWVPAHVIPLHQALPDYWLREVAILRILLPWFIFIWDPCHPGILYANSLVYCMLSPLNKNSTSVEIFILVSLPLDQYCHQAKLVIVISGYWSSLGTRCVVRLSKVSVWLWVTLGT